jgi:hypothetical protein
MMTSRRFSFLKNGLAFSEVQRPRNKISKLGDSSCEKCYDTQDMSCPFYVVFVTSIDVTWKFFKMKNIKDLRGRTWNLIALRRLWVVTLATDT